jgi:hypothetical protein
LDIQQGRHLHSPPVEQGLFLLEYIDLRMELEHELGRCDPSTSPVLGSIETVAHGRRRIEYASRRGFSSRGRSLNLGVENGGTFNECREACSAGQRGKEGVGRLSWLVGAIQPAVMALLTEQMFERFRRG